MKNVYDLLQQKEFDIRRVQREIEALHFVIPLLADDADWLEQGIVVASSFSTRSSPGQNVSRTAA